MAPLGQGRCSLARALRPWPLAVLLIAVLLFHRRVLFSSRWTIPWDFRDYHLPLAAFMARCLRSGELPLWDPYTYCGMPFYANIQTQFAYPPLWITLALSNLAGGGHLLEFLEWYVVLHVFLAGAFAYAMLRRLGLSHGAAAFGATTFELGGYFASQLQHVGAISAAAWLPLAWLSVFELASGFSRRWLGLLALALAMALLAGFPAVTIVVWVSTFWLALLLAGLRRAPPKLALWALVGSGWAVLLSAVQLLPALELSRHSTAFIRGEFAGTGGGVPVLALVSLLKPDHNNIFDLSKYKLEWNPTFLYLYCGLAGVSLALAGLFTSRSRCKAPVAVLTLVACLWMLGENTIVGRTAFALLPTILKSPLYAEFAMAAFQLGLVTLAALGVERLVGRRVWLVGLLLAIAVVDLTRAGGGRMPNTFPVSEDPAVTPEQFEGSLETLEHMRTLVNRTTPPARVESFADSMRWANSAPMTGIPTASGNDPLAPARVLAVRRLFGKGQPWLRYWELADLDSPLPDLLNVGYLVSWAPTDKPVLEHRKWRRAARLPGHQVYENSSVLPRFYLVGRVRHASSKEEALSWLRAPGFDPRREAVVEGANYFALEQNVAGNVRVLDYRLREVLLETEARGPAFLVSSETYYPGWRAWIDGQPARLLLANVAFRGLVVPAGKHRVRMLFQPRILIYGLCLSLLGGGLLLWAFGWPRARWVLGKFAGRKQWRRSE